MTVKIVSPDNLERYAQGADEKFAEASHTHSTATTTSAGFMSAEDKQNLDDLVQNGGSGGIQEITTGSTNGTISVDGTDIAVKGLGSAAYTASTDYATSGHTHSYLPLSGGTLTGKLKLSTEGLETANASGIKLDQYGNFKFQADNTTCTWHVDKYDGTQVLTVGADGTVKVGGTAVSLNGHTHSYAATSHTHTASLATDSGTATVTLAHNTTYKLTAGGSSIIFKTPADNNTTYSNMTAATASAAGKAGLVPAPAAGKQASFLRGDGTWVVPTNTTYSNFVKSGSDAKNGLVPAPSTTAGTTKYLREDCTWQVPPNTGDTKNTAGSTNSTSKLFLIGATSQAANPQTYSHSGVYETNGALVAVSFQATSDRRKKKDIKELGDLNLSGIKSYNYTLTSNGEKRTGLIAQEVMDVIPDAVKSDEKGFLSLDYNAVVAVLVNKVNQLEARISELENK
jgi:hypothetical protein